jgi:GNAT superfamily N-acetyltransferase
MHPIAFRHGSGPIPYQVEGAVMNERLTLRAVICCVTIITVVVLHALTFAADPSPRHRRILYNFDGDADLWTRAGAKTPVAITLDDVRQRIDEVTYKGSQVDTVLVCVGAQAMYYPTRVGTMRGALSSPEERAKWPASERQLSENLQRFLQANVDPHAVMLAEAKRRGREALLTFRMNDAHGFDFLRTQFWTDHPGWRLGGALDFAHEAVRDYTFRLIEEAVQRYDSDGLEMDFNRFPTFFKNGTETARIQVINDLVHRVRLMVDAEARKRGKRLVLAARVPTSYRQCRQIGLDPVVWAREGWIDFLTISEFLFTRYDLPVRPWKELIREVPIYGSVECEEGPAKEQYMTAEKYRRAARHLWQDGADGIYLFNFFASRVILALRPTFGDWGWEPCFELLKELGDPSMLQRR